ncbi:Ldh family oxidoreductase [Azospirillum halopraeferens]|uniref:Ldh family oxidoreductase n=1 Tax=Azospirillum halopraeferens TaxID=34010 RepID=UPI00042625A1|nr:Ldh family oxidoreductase [Azospirillum halopraeferens]
MQLNALQLKEMATAVLVAHGVPEAFADDQADLLVEAELRGLPSHGVLRLPRIVERIRNRVIDPCATGSPNWFGQSFLQVDGRGGLGPVVALAALQAARERAEETGVCVAAVANGNHLGMLAWYVERLAGQGHAAIAMTTSEALVHPWGGRVAMMGTNPIAIGVPAVPDPFILDLATSVVAMGRIHDHADRGEPIPQEWALDRDGNPTTDPEAAKNGAIAPFGGAKGYALGLGIEVLVAALTRSAIGRNVAGTLDSERPCNKGDLFIVFGQQNSAATRLVSSYLEEVRRSPAAPGFAAVDVPGDGMRRRRAAALRDGVWIADDLWHRLRRLRAGEVGA